MDVIEALEHMYRGCKITRERFIYHADTGEVYNTILFMVNEGCMNQPKVVHVDRDGNTKMGYLFDCKDIMAKDWIVLDGD